MRIVLICFVFFHTQTLLGQEIFNKHFDIENGLPSDEVYDVVEDNEGYLWFATDLGVSRYNGYEFENFTFDSTKLDNAILKLHKDPFGKIWFISLNGYLAYYNYDKIIAYERNNELGPFIKRIGIYSSFHVAKDSAIYFGVKNLGLIVIKKGLPFELINGEEEGKPQEIFRYLDQHDDFLSYYYRISTNADGVDHSEILFNGEILVSVPPLSSQSWPFFKAVLIGEEKWMCSINNSIFIFENGSILPVLETDKDIIYLIKDHRNVLWAGQNHGGGLVSFNIETREEKKYLQGKSVSSVFQDSQGGIWCTTTEKGVYYSNNYLNKYYFSEYAKENTITASVLYEDTLLTVFANGRIEAIFEDSVYVKNNIQSDKSFYWIDYIAGDIYAGTSGFHGTYKLVGEVYEKVEVLLHDNKVRAIACLKNDTAFLRAYKWNEVKVQKDSLKTLFKAWAGTRFDCSFQDSTGIYWGNKSGLLTPENNKLKNLSTQYSIEGKRVVSIDKNRRGDMVLGTKSSGVKVINGGGTVSITKTEGLSSNNITDVICEYDTIWCSTRHGLNKLVYDDHKQKYIVESHTIESNVLISQNIYEAFPIKGYVYLLTPKGVVKLHRASFSKEINSIQLNITSIKVKDEIFTNFKEASLKHNQNGIKFNFTAIDYKSGGKLQYYYRLNGSSEFWESTPNRSIEYPALPSGKYQFEMYAKNSKCKSEVFRFEFEIFKPWWNTVYAYILYVISLASLIYLVVLWRTSKLQSKQVVLEEIVKERTIEIELQRDLAERQKLIVQEKNKEVLDSITYAKRIQAAILPPDRLFKKWLKNYFIFYKPKDIVAGDFYWLETVGSKVLFAAADCTGHGVPGALVSVICHNALNRAVREFNLIEPAAILNKTRELVVETFSRSDETVRDGMDISLCSIDIEKKELQYAGANNALYIVRDEKNKAELTTIKPDKQPVGNFGKPFPFTNHVVPLKESDTIYVYTDGYVDQFGGERGKKFKHKNFIELLLSLQDVPMLTRREILYKEFTLWQREFDQVDDVCVIGVKI